MCFGIKSAVPNGGKCEYLAFTGTVFDYWTSIWMVWAFRLQHTEIPVMGHPLFRTPTISDLCNLFLTSPIFSCFRIGKHPLGGRTQCRQDSPGCPIGHKFWIPVRQDLQPRGHGRLHRVCQMRHHQKDFWRRIPFDDVLVTMLEIYLTRVTKLFTTLQNIIVSSIHRLL